MGSSQSNFLADAPQATSLQLRDRYWFGEIHLHRRAVVVALSLAHCPQIGRLLWFLVEVCDKWQDSMSTAERALTRREPKQKRSQQTVEAVLEAVQLVVKRHGMRAITTNRIAEAAGVSIGSLYQYFPDKRAIFAALHDRHVDEVRQLIEQTMTACRLAPLDEFARELVQGLMNAHAGFADLHDAVSSAVPENALGFKRALHHSFRQMLSYDEQQRYSLDERSECSLSFREWWSRSCTGRRIRGAPPFRAMAPRARQSAP